MWSIMEYYCYCDTLVTESLVSNRKKRSIVPRLRKQLGDDKCYTLRKVEGHWLTKDNRTINGSENNNAKPLIFMLMSCVYAAVLCWITVSWSLWTWILSFDWFVGWLYNDQLIDLQKVASHTNFFIYSLTSKCYCDHQSLSISVTININP